MERVRKLLRLGGTERRLLVRATLLLTAVRVGLWLLPFRTLERMLAARSVGKARARGTTASSVEAVAWAVESAGRCVPQAATCLTRALAAQALLRRGGHPALIHIGAARDDGGGFSAHAWVESGGRVVIGGHELERYTLLTTLGGESLVMPEAGTP